MLPTVWVETYTHFKESFGACQHGFHEPDLTVSSCQSCELYFLQVSHGNLIGFPMVSVMAQEI
jgi:hypothetical protein